MSSVTTLTATRNVLFRPQTKLLDFKIFLSDRAAYSKRGVDFFLEMRCHNFSSQEIAACPLKSK